MFKKIKLTVIAGALSLLALACGGSGKTSISILPSIEAHQQERLMSKEIDILFVIDDSGSMKPVQTNLNNNFGVFIDEFYQKGFDFRVAVVKTSAYGSPSPGETGRTVHEFRCGFGNDCGAGVQTYSTCSGYPSDPTTMGNGTPGVGTDHILSSSELDKDEMIEKFQRNADVGLCGSGDERAFQAAETVLRNHTTGVAFPRPDAHFAVIHVGDEPDGRWSGASTSNGNGSLNAHNLSGIRTSNPSNSVEENMLTVWDYVSALESHDPSATISVHAIQNLTSACDPASHIGHPQIYMASIATGLAISICDDFAEELANLGDHIIQLAEEFYLNSTDIREETLRVFVDEVEILRTENPLDTSGFLYLEDPSRVKFLGSDRPEEGARIEVTFTGRFLRGN